VEKILLSVMSLLAEPNDESPADVDMAKLFRDNPKAYWKLVRRRKAEIMGIPYTED
jgi:ubiquitin-protein ligase